MAQIAEQLRPVASTPVNRDFEPIAYYFGVVLWSAQFKLSYSHLFESGAHVTFSAVMGVVAGLSLLAAIVVWALPGRERRAPAAAGYCMAATGFTVMALQVFVLLAFQSVYGYVYHQLAVLIAMSMAGIAIGSWLGIRRAREASTCSRMAATQLLLAIAAPALMLVVSLLAKTSGVATTWLAAQLVFPVLAALCGMLGGYQFRYRERRRLCAAAMGGRDWARCMPSTCLAGAWARWC